MVVQALQAVAHAVAHFAVEAAAEGAGEAVVFGSVVDEVGGFDFVAGDAVYAAEAVDEAGFFGFDAGIDAAAEDLRVVCFQTAAASGFDGLDEFAVDLVEHLLPDGLLFGGFGGEGIAHAFSDGV